MHTFVRETEDDEERGIEREGEAQKGEGRWWEEGSKERPGPE